MRVALVRNRDVALAPVDSDFGNHVGTLDKWLRQERIESGEREGQSRSPILSVSAPNDWKRCVRLT